MATMRSIITAALRRLGANSANAVPTAEDTDVCLQAMNSLIDSMSNNLLNIHTITPHRFLLNPLQQTYKLGPALDVSGNPTNADWVIQRPMRIETAVLLAYPAVSTTCVPGNTCGWVSSIEDANTIDLWHLDEGIGATEIAPTVSYDGTLPYDISGGFELFDGACSTAVRSTLGGGSIHFANSASGGLGPGPGISAFTLEFMALNAGTTSPYPNDYAEVARMDLVSYGFGEGILTIRIFKQGQDLAICKNADVYYPLVVIPMEVDTWVPLAFQFGEDGTYSIFAGGTQVYTDTFENLTGYSSWDDVYGSFEMYSDTNADIAIDEFRRSDIARYSGTTYETWSEPTPGECTTTIGTTSSTMFYPLALLNYRQFASLTAREIQSTWPTQVYDNAAYPVRELSFWPVPQNAYAVELWLWAPLATYETLDDELNLPPGYERYLILKLAMEVAPEFGKQVTETLKATLMEAENVVKTLNQQQTRMNASVAGYAVGGRRPSWMAGSAVPYTIPTQV
jgi:hypothetical protein